MPYLVTTKDASVANGTYLWDSPYSLYCKLTGKIPFPAPGEAAQQREDLEPYVLDRWLTATGKGVTAVGANVTNASYPHSAGWVEYTVNGENAGLSLRTLATWYGDDYDSAAPPDMYYTQAQHLMALTGKTTWYFSVLIALSNYICYTFTADPAAIAALMAAEEEFRDCVNTDTPPPPDNSKYTAKALAIRYPGNPALQPVDLIALDSGLLAYDTRRGQIKALQAQNDQFRNQVHEEMGDATEGVSTNYTVTFRPVTREYAMLKMLKTMYKTVWDVVKRAVVSRSLVVKEK